MFLEYLEKESKEKEEKINKIKLVAVKAKKELDSNRKEVRWLKKASFKNPTVLKIKFFCP